MHSNLFHFHHLGVACQDIDSVKQWLKKTFIIVKEGETIFDPIQNANLCMLEMEGDLKIELISGVMVEKILKRNMSLYHICYSVKDIKQAVQTLKETGAVVFSEPKKAVLFHDHFVAFLMTPMGIVELVEE